VDDAMGAAAPLLDQPRVARAARAAVVPWPVVLATVATTSIVTGVVWDISWHRTIGRDTFFTPAHLAIYLGAIVAGLSGAFQILAASARAGRACPGVRIWGMRGPLGAWVAVWGAAAMLTSAPFDDWWHNAYGLDVEILSPPHVVLGLGMTAIQLGSLLLILAYQNRDDGGAGPALAVAFVYAAGAMLFMKSAFLTEWMMPNSQHRATFYKIAAATFPVVLVAVGRAGRLRWPATAAASIYVGLSLASVWILPLFPGRPLLGPIFNPVDHMVPPPFPVLLFVPAVAIDLLLQRIEGRDWILSVAAGAAFLWIFFAVQWPLADFLMTPAARNWVFASDRWDYNIRPGSWQHQFWWAHQDVTSARALLVATVFAAASSRVGLWLGGWMRRVVR
jgi:hypothetical protein